MPDQSEPNPASSLALPALRTLLGYLFQQVRCRDGVPLPPLFDRDDFLDCLNAFADAPAVRGVEREAARWLAEQLRAYGAELPGEPPFL